MSASMELLAVYLHLARASQRRRRPHVRDRLLTLGAVIAAEEGLPRIAAYCRHCVLAHNPQHLLHRWPTLRDALGDPEFIHFLRHLRRRYPQEKAERMLDALGIDTASERAAYYSDEEYAASLLGIGVAQLEAMFGGDAHP